MLESGDNLTVDVSSFLDWVKVVIDGGNVNVDLHELPIKRPYLINRNHIEYVEGTWNDDKSEYGIRIGYASGATRCFWGSTARSVLEALVLGNKKERETYEIKESICKKFDDRVKVGPPSA